MAIRHLSAISLLAALMACGGQSSSQEDERFIGDQMALQTQPAYGVFEEKELRLPDGNGHELVIQCLTNQINVFYTPDGLDNFYMKSVWRLDNEEAYQAYLTEMELDASDEDYWTYDDDQAAYEVSFPISFLHALAKSSALSVELQPDGASAQGGTIAISKEVQTTVKGCLEYNQERVVKELRALGYVE